MAKILLIDDDRLFSQIYATRLTAERHQVDLCLDGQSAIDKLGQKYDFIFLDIMMPQIGGLELLKKIALTINVTTPVVVLTNLIDEETKKNCLQTGAREYLIKADFTPNQLLDKIKGYL
ncbi:MAG: response regulator transcription factor [Candidatus Shapirobacteria bacterium]